MSEKITLLPDKLAERKTQIGGRIAIIARTRFEHTRGIEKLDKELIGLEARHNEIEVAEGNYKAHTALEKAREGDGKKPKPSKKGK